MYGKRSSKNTDGKWCAKITEKHTLFYTHEGGVKKFIYSRVSTSGQCVEAQILELKKRYPDADVISEVGSGSKARPMLEALIENVERGDMIIIYALDRLGRKTTDVLRIVEAIEKKGVILVSKREGVDYSTPVGKLVTQILVSVSEMERNLISERTRAGLLAAKAKGRLIGRKPTIPDEIKERAIELVCKSGLSLRKAAAEVGMNHSYLGQLVRERSRPTNGELPSNS